MPEIAPSTSVAIAVGVVDETCCSKRATPVSSTPRLFSQPPLLSTAALELARDLVVLRGDPADHQHDDHACGRDDEEQDEHGSGRPRDAMSLQPTDDGHRDGGDDDRRENRIDDRGGGAEQPGEPGEDEEDAGEQPGAAAEVAEPARGCEHRREVIELAPRDRPRLALRQGCGRRRVNPLPEPQVHARRAAAVVSTEVEGSGRVGRRESARRPNGRGLVAAQPVPRPLVLLLLIVPWSRRSRSFSSWSSTSSCVGSGAGCSPRPPTLGSGRGRSRAGGAARASSRCRPRAREPAGIGPVSGRFWTKIR